VIVSPDAAEGRDRRRRRTELLQGEQIDRSEMDEINVRIEPKARAGKRSPPCCSASRKASLQTRSFHLAASFQETTRVLTEAAVNARPTRSSGLKENVIVGA